MKSIRFNQIKAGDCRYLRTTLRPNDSIDNQVVDIVFENSDLHILPVTTCTEYDGIVEVLLGNYICLDKVFKNSIEKEVLLTIFFNLIKELSRLTRKGIKLKYIILNKRYLYVNPEDLSIRFVCIPVENVEHNVDFKVFLRGLLASARYSNSDNLEYVGRLLNCINSNEYSNTKLVELIREIGGQNIGKPVKYIYNEQVLGEIEEASDSVAGEVTEVNMFDGQIEDMELAKKFEEVRKTEVKEPIVEPVIEVKKEPQPVAKPKYMPVSPYLVRMATNEKIHIDRERFNLGKSPMSNHYVIDNERVSRYHCAIVYRNGRYYIKDNGSTNCTYVNGIDIGDMAVELVHNTTIHIASEEFLFILI